MINIEIKELALNGNKPTIKQLIISNKYSIINNNNNLTLKVTTNII